MVDLVSVDRREAETTADTRGAGICFRVGSLKKKESTRLGGLG
jgi:hypothetical protein